MSGTVFQCSVPDFPWVGGGGAEREHGGVGSLTLEQLDSNQLQAHASLLPQFSLL